MAVVAVVAVLAVVAVVAVVAVWEWSEFTRSSCGQSRIMVNKSYKCFNN